MAGLKIVKKAPKKLDKFNFNVQNLFINEHIDNQYNDRLYAVDLQIPLQITNEMT